MPRPNAGGRKNMPKLEALQEHGDVVCRVPQRGGTPGFTVYDYHTKFFMTNTENNKVKQISMQDRKWYEELSRKYYRGELH